MGYFSGSVTSFAGASGLLQTIMGHIVGTEVSGESLSGSGTSWSGSLANSPVGLGRLIIDYEFSSVAYQGVDDGAGNITGTNISSGSITYSTGAYSITFTGTPDGTPTADYIYGEQGSDWRVELNRTTRDNGGAGYTEPCAGCKEVVLSNTGLSGQETVLIGIRECFESSENFYAWNLNAYTTFSDTGEWNQNSTWTSRTEYSADWNNFTTHPNLVLLDDTIYYWLYTNTQRIIVVAKVSSNYESAYMGFGRRFGNPGDYPYPVFLGGSCSGNRKQSNTEAFHTFFINGTPQTGHYHVWVFTPGVALRTYSGIWNEYNGVNAVPYDDWNDQGPLDPTRFGERLMTPVYICSASSGLTITNATYFDLDGVFHIAGVSIQSEDLINYAGSRYRVFQNCFRTEYYDYMAIEEGAAVSTTTTTTTTSTTTTTT